jgi:hypothetical protein
MDLQQIKCNVSLTINQEETEIDRKPTQHQHKPFTQCELDVRQAKKDMRTKAGESLEVKPRTAYSDLVKSLTNKGHLLTDIGNAGLLSFQRSRNSINKSSSMVKSRNKLPKSLNEIDFSLKIFIPWTLTIEKNAVFKVAYILFNALSDDDGESTVTSKYNTESLIDQDALVEFKDKEDEFFDSNEIDQEVETKLKLICSDAAIEAEVRLMWSFNSKQTKRHETCQLILLLIN